MKKINFIPLWYENEIYKYKCSLLKKAIFLIVTINILLAFFIIKNNGTFKTLQGINNIEAKKVEEKAMKENHKELGALPPLNYFISDFAGKVQWTNINIEDKKISFETLVSDKNGYYDLLKLIEKEKRYKLISILKIEEESGLKLKVSLEVIL